MCRSCGQFLAVGLIITGVLALASPIPGQTSGKDTGKDTAKGKDKVDPGKLKPDQAKVDLEKEKGEKHYKEIFETEEAPPFHESVHFLIYGKGNRNLVTFGTDLEQAYAKACKVLELEPNPGPWPGKLTVFLIHDAKRYPQSIRILQRRKADDDEIGSYEMDPPTPHVTACPSKVAGEQSMESTACTQVGAWLISYKAKTRVPEWMGEGFGRATMLHVWGDKILAADRRKAAASINKDKRTLNDIITNNLKAEELPVLRASFMDYLAYSNRTGKFLPILTGFSAPPKNTQASFDAGLKNADISQENLDKNWQAYAKSFK
jgi:hypothetical protein